MTGKDQDPFERLSQLAAPKPDPAKIAAVAAMSARAFAADLAQPSRPEAGASRLVQWIKGTNWLMPVSALAFAVVAAVLLVPLIMQPNPNDPSSSDTMLSREPAVAEAEPSESQTDGVAPAEEEGRRLGAVPGPSAPADGLPLDLRTDVAVETYTFDDIEIMVRSAPEEVGLYLMAGSIERQFDRRFKEPSQTIVLTDAFRHPSDAQLLLIRSGIEGGHQQWDAFVEGANGYALSGAISMQIHDAADRADVIARLESASEP